MKYLILPFAALSFVACQPAETKAPSDGVDGAVSETANDNQVIEDGKVNVRLMNPASEPRACIVPIRIENGLEDDVNVIMIGFSITGPGDDTKGNMFAPVAAPGEVSEARVILEGQSCDAFDTITVPEIVCKTVDESCVAKINFVDGDELSFSQAG